MTASQDQENLLQAERLASEWLAVEEALDKANIEQTIVFFGSARIEDKHTAEIMLKNARELTSSANDNTQAKIALHNAELSLNQSIYYEQARQLARKVGTLLNQCKMTNTRMITGGGPGIMEAANRGSMEVGRKSVGLNIEIPKEQRVNPYLSEETSFQFHYFSLRKMHFLKRAKVIIVFPGGYGTLDELMEVLTLIQTQKISPIPIILFGTEYWSRAVDFEYLAEQQYIDSKDLRLYSIVDDIESAYQLIASCIDCKIDS